MGAATRANTSPYCRALTTCLAALVPLLLWGCAANAPTTQPPQLVHHGPVVSVAEVDVLEVTPEMAEFVAHYAPGYRAAETRLALLTTAVVSEGVLGFDYRVERTLTAREAFEQRTGNCVGFSNLMVALARTAGLQARFQEISLEPQWFSEDDTLLVAKHINVVVSAGGRSWVVDSSGVETRPTDLRRLITDSEARALYFNNRAVDALIRGDLYRSWAWLLLAVETAPRLPDAWINLGVVYGRSGQWQAAEAMYRQALELDSGNYSALSNLYSLYEAVGEGELAARYADRVERYRRRNPYHLLRLGEEAMAEARLEESRELFQAAIERKPDEHRFHFALARSQYLAGDIDGAVTSLERARQLAPESVRAEYRRPWEELVDEP